MKINIWSARHPVWQTAFRPFFLLASIHFIASLVVWISFLEGKIPGMNYWWHPYEMVFGFSRAIIIGFIFTAAQNWTGKTLLQSRGVMSLALLWAAGRLIFFVPGIWSWLLFAADMTANLFMVAILIPAFAIEHQRHNRTVSRLTLLFTVSQMFSWLAIQGVLWPEITGILIRSGLWIVLLFIILIAGRIMPFFTGVVLPQSGARRHPWIEKYVLALSMPLALLELITQWQPFWVAAAAGYSALLGALHLVRWALWQPGQTIRLPILAVLHFAYLLLPVGLLCYALYLSGVIPASVVWHVLGLGCATVFILGMITRVALGHTGRPIRASRVIIIAYLLLVASLVLRLVAVRWSSGGLVLLLSAILAGTAFIIYILEYFPRLLTARPDGKKG